MQLVVLTVPEQWRGLGAAAASATWALVAAALVGKILSTLKEIGLAGAIPELLTDKPKPQTLAAP